MNPNPSDSVGSWMLTVFLMGIPIVGFIYVLVLAFGGTQSISKQNFARATLIWMLIGLVIGVIIAVVIAATGGAIFAGLVNASTSY